MTRRSDSRANSSVPRVAFALAEFPHYRGGVFRALDLDPRFKSTFIGDQTPRAPLETVDPATLSDVRYVHNSRYRTLYWQRNMFTALLRGRYDVVVFLGDTHVLSTWLFAPLCRLLGREVLFWTIGWHRPEPRRTRWVKNLYYRSARLVMVYGRQGFEFGERSGFPPGRMRIIGNSIEGPPVRTTTEELERDAIICVGRLTPAKDLDVLLETLGSEADLRQVPVIIVGEGPEEQSLRRTAARLGLDVTFAGGVHDPEGLAHWYRRAALTVVPGAAGLTVIQSIGFGVPVLAHDSFEHQMPEVDAIIPGRTGAFFHRGDQHSLGIAIRELLRSRGADTQVECVAEYRRNWTPATHADRITTAILEVLRPGP